MQIIERRTESGMTLELRGALQGDACCILDRAVGRQLANGVRRITVELSGVVAIDAEGVGMLARQFVRVVTRDGTLTLRHPPRRVRQMLVVAGVADVIDALADTGLTGEPRCCGADRCRC